LAGAGAVSVDVRAKIFKFIENISGGTAVVKSMHGAGSPQTQKVMYGRLEKRSGGPNVLLELNDRNT